MRTPWYVVVLSCLIVILMTYWLSTCKKNIVGDAPSDEELASYDEKMRIQYGVEKHDTVQDTIAKQADKLSTSIQDTSPSNSPEDTKTPTSPAVKVTPKSKLPDLPDTSVVYDLNGMHAFTETASGFAVIAREYQKRDDIEHATLAWERLLDQTEPNDTLITEAYNYLKNSRPSLPVWNAQSDSAIKLTLHASVPGDLVKKITSILKLVSEEITAASGHTIEVTSKVSVLAGSQDKPRPSVSIWFSGKKETPRFHFQTRSVSETSIDARIQASIFNLVRSNMEKNETASTLTELPVIVTPMDTLRYLITRYTWKEFGKSLYE